MIFEDLPASQDFVTSYGSKPFGMPGSSEYAARLVVVIKRPIGADNLLDEAISLCIELWFSARENYQRRQSRKAMSAAADPWASREVRRKVDIYAGIASLNSVSLGIAIGLVSTVSPLVKKQFDLNGLELGAYQASLSFFAIFGAAAASLTLDPFGRRIPFMISSVLFMLGYLLEASAQGKGMLLFGSALAGIASGYGLAIDPIFIAEMSPVSKRGYYVTWSEISICAGELVGFLVGLSIDAAFDSTSSKWRVMCLCGIVSPLVLLLLVIFVLPESPRWLAVNGRGPEAIGILVDSLELPRPAAEKLVEDVQHDHSLENVREPTPSCSSQGPLWSSMIFSENAAIRYVVLVGVGTAVCQQLSGIDPVLFEFVFILNDIGITSSSSAYALLVLVGVLKLAAAISASRLLDRAGRRPLIVSSAAVSAIILALLVATYALEDQIRAFQATVVFLLTAFAVAFEIGLGPGCWLVPSEVFFNKIRLPAMGMATLSNRIVDSILISTATLVRQAVGWTGFFSWFAFTCLSAFLFLLVYLPETKGKSLEEMYDYVSTLVHSGGRPQGAPIRDIGGGGGGGQQQGNPLGVRLTEEPSSAVL